MSNTMRNYDVILVGGGIVGAATFYKMQKRYPEKTMLLIDKMDVLADHQTGNNSGVIHSGLYYKPGSLKAENCVKGRHELVKFEKENNVPHDVCGKVVVAATEAEQPSLNKIHKLGLENNIEGIELINGTQLREIEPECRGEAALWVPCTGIIDFRDATKKMVDVALSIQEKSAVHLSEEVLDFANEGDGTLVKTSKATYFAQHLIVCGGLQADRLARKDGVKLIFPPKRSRSATLDMDVVMERGALEGEVAKVLTPFMSRSHWPPPGGAAAAGRGRPPPRDRCARPPARPRPRPPTRDRPPRRRAP